MSKFYAIKKGSICSHHFFYYHNKDGRHEIELPQSMSDCNDWFEEQEDFVIHESQLLDRNDFVLVVELSTIHPVYEWWVEIFGSCRVPHAICYVINDSVIGIKACEQMDEILSLCNVGSQSIDRAA